MKLLAETQRLLQEEKENKESGYFDKFLSFW